MLEPKTFYRKLDFLLNRIGREKSGKDFLSSIAKELENTFGSDLKICNGHIYEEFEEDFVLIISNPKNPMAKSIPVNSQVAQNVINNKTYIYDDLTSKAIFGIKSTYEYSIPVAMYVSNPECRWIFVFELRSGWIREEVEFCFNAVRAALNYRLYSEAFKNDLEQAAYIQQSLLPVKSPEISGYDIAAKSIPAELVGGDLYDYFQFDGEGFGVCVGDASGHGLPAALLVRDVVTGLRMGMEREMKLVYTLKKLNNVIYRSVYSTRFISLFIAEIEQNGNLLYVNAGHPSPILVHKNQLSELQSTGLIFGALPEIALHSSYAKMNPGSILVIYTDGIIERKNRKKEDFGNDRLNNIILTNQDKSAKEIVDIIFDQAFEFGKKAKWMDDATILVIKKNLL